MQRIMLIMAALLCCMYPTGAAAGPSIKVTVSNLQHRGLSLPPCRDHPGHCTIEYTVQLQVSSGGMGDFGVVQQDAVSGRHFIDCLLNMLESDRDGDGVPEDTFSEFSGWQDATISLGNVTLHRSDTGWETTTVDLNDVPFDAASGRFRIYLD